MPRGGRNNRDRKTPGADGDASAPPSPGDWQVVSGRSKPPPAAANAPPPPPAGGAGGHQLPSAPLRACPTSVAETERIRLKRRLEAFRDDPNAPELAFPPNLTVNEARSARAAAARAPRA